MVVHGNKGGTPVMFRGMDFGNPGILWKSLDPIVEFCPGFSPIPGQLHIAIIGPDPYDALFYRRFIDVKDGTVEFGRRIILIYFPTRSPLFGFIIGGKIFTDLLPGMTTIC